MALGPIDYTTQVASPFAAAAQGYQFGSAIRADQAAQQQAEAQRAQQMQMQQELAALAANPNPTARDYTAVMTRYPSLAENLSKSWSAMSAEQQQAKLSRRTQIFAAMSGGAYDVAERLLRNDAAAKRAAGLEKEAAEDEMVAELTKLEPGAARTSAALWLTGTPGGEKVVEAATKLQTEGRAQALQPGLVRKGAADAVAAEAEAVTKGAAAAVAPQMAAANLTNAQATAQKAAVAAKFAESEAVQALEKGGWDIKKLQNDIQIAKQNTAIAAANAATARAGNDLKRQELQLKVGEMVQKRDETVRTKAAEVESARFNIDNFLNQADRILSVGVGKDGKPSSVARAATGPIDSRLPTVQRDVSDFEALVETLGSQAFLSQIPNVKGMGQLSNTEGDKLQAALQNLALRQSPEQLVANIKEAQRLMLKARKNVADRYGVPESVPDTPAAASATSPASIDALLKKYGGK